VRDNDKLVMFDATYRNITSMADVIDRLGPVDRAEYVRLVVESVTAQDGTVDPATITYTPPVRPFFGVPVMAPPDGLWGSPPDSGDLLEYYAAS